MSFSAVILAGGQSSRMGRDKAWLEVGGRPLIARQVNLVRVVGAQEVLISGRMEVDYTSLGCPVLKDRFPGAGPLAGIEAALAAAISPLVLVLAVDMPRMGADVLRQLVGQCTETTGAIPRVAGEIEPLAAVYPKSALRLVTELLSKTAAKAPAARTFAERCVATGLARIVEFPATSANCYTNWNSPADVAADD